MSQQGPAPDSSSSILWGIAVLFIAISLIGYFWGQEIGRFYLQMKLFQLKIMSPLEIILPQMGELREEIGIVLAENAEGEKLTYSLGEYMQIGKIVGRPFNIVLMGIIGWFAWKVYKSNPMQKYRRKMSMKDLAMSEQKLWYAIAPTAPLNLIDEPIDSGQWAMSPKPLDFARKYKLLNLNEKEKLTLDEEAMKRAEKLFASQLGRLWGGPGKMPSYARALFACFIAFGNGDKDSADAGLEKLARGHAAGKVDYSWVKPLLSKHYNTPQVQAFVKQHAYMFTVMASALEFARGMGVIPSANFIWLKPVNRQLWYVLNGVGRKVAFCEVAGIYAHWLAEKVATHPIEKPYVKKAVKALDLALQEVKLE